MVRLKDIAEAAGVSIMSVSKALRDEPDLSPATKARLKALAQQMGYVPDQAARGLREKVSHLFGLIIPASTDPVAARLVLALEEHTHALGYDLLIGHSLGKVDREETIIRRMLSRRLDGLFIAPVYRLDPTAPIYEHLRRAKLPLVLLGHAAPFCEGFARVETDDIHASAVATRHLLDLGHRRIAFLGGPMNAPWAQERLEGYRRAHRDTGVPLDDRLIFNAGATVEEGASAALQLIQEQPGATAVQAVNDLVAIGAADILVRQGIRVPQDMSVVGFGNVLVSEFFRVPLTTIRQPKLRLGIAAVELMQHLLKGETVPPRRLPAELIVRASTGPAAVGVEIAG
jgi:LacI family transcriptional regulator